MGRGVWHKFTGQWYRGMDGQIHSWHRQQKKWKPEGKMAENDRRGYTTALAALEKDAAVKEKVDRRANQKQELARLRAEVEERAAEISDDDIDLVGKNANQSQPKNQNRM